MYSYFRKSLTNFRSGQPNPGLFNAHSPYNTFIQDIENKRSRLFPDRRKVPGRKFKFIAAIGLVVHYYYTSKIAEAKKQWKVKEEMMRKMQRKVVPYFSAIEDIEFMTVKNRNDLIFGEIFKDKGGMDYVKNWKRFNNQIVWDNPQSTYKWVLAGTGRSESTFLQTGFGRHTSGLVDKNA